MTAGEHGTPNTSVESTTAAKGDSVGTSDAEGGKDAALVCGAAVVRVRELVGDTNTDGVTDGDAPLDSVAVGVDALNGDPLLVGASVGVALIVAELVGDTDTDGVTDGEAPLDSVAVGVDALDGEPLLVGVGVGG